MLKYLGEPTIVFAEFPDEISLCLNITNCPCMCSKCSEPELHEDVGIEITELVVDDLIKGHPGISLIGFMGGDVDHDSLVKLVDYIHEQYPNMKVGFYSGRNYLNLDLAEKLDYYKIGEFRMFTGDIETWKDQTAGPICLPTSNQIMFKKVDGKLVNITDKFRKIKINNWATTII